MWTNHLDNFCNTYLYLRTLGYNVTWSKDRDFEYAVPELQLVFNHFDIMDMVMAIHKGKEYTISTGQFYNLVVKICTGKGKP